jgi:hypothetical protein
MMRSGRLHCFASGVGCWRKLAEALGRAVDESGKDGGRVGVAVWTN